MTANPVLLTQGGDTTNGTVYTTASISPGPTRVMYVAVFASAPSGGTTGTPTLSADVGQTWELTLRAPQADDIRAIFVFRSTTTASPSSGPLTITFPNTIASAVWAVYEVDGADLTTPTVQSVQEQRKGSTNVSVDFAFADPVDPDNACLAFVGVNQQVDITPGTGWTAGGPTAQISAPANSLLPMHATTAQQNVAASWATAGNTWVIGVEVKAAGAAPDPPGEGTASGSHTWTGTASASTDHAGTSSAGEHAWAGQASGSTDRSGSASGSHTWTGSASGFAPVEGVNSGSASGSHTWTGSASGSAPATLPPPAGLTVTPASSSRLDLSWEPVADAVAYDVERDGVVIVFGLPGTTYSDTGLDPSTTYTYRVRATQ